MSAILADGTNVLVGTLVSATTLDPHVQGETGTFSIFASSLPPAPTAPTPEEKLTDDENLLRIRLKFHLDNNLSYYYRLIWLGEDPNARYLRLRGTTLSAGGSSWPIFEAIMNRPLDVLGDGTAFALDPQVIGMATSRQGQYPAMPEVAPARVESVISLPARGVFAEAKLGHCNAAEVIDNTRFWDWQTSPDPDAAPSIGDVSLASRNAQPALAATTLPGSLVNIVNPAPAPDPVAMAGALGLLGKSDIFRDMSMQSQVGALTQALASDATSMTLAQIAQGKAGGGASSGGSASGSGPTSPASTTSAATPPASASSGGDAGAGATTSGGAAPSQTTPSASSGTGSSSANASATPTPAPSQPKAQPAPAVPPQPSTVQNRTFNFSIFQITWDELKAQNAKQAVRTVRVTLNQNGKAIAPTFNRTIDQADSVIPVILSAPADPTIGVEIITSVDVTFLGNVTLETAATIDTDLPTKIVRFQPTANPTFTLHPEVSSYTFTVTRDLDPTPVTQSTSHAVTNTDAQTIGAALTGIAKDIAQVSLSGSMESSSSVANTVTTTLHYNVYTGNITITNEGNTATK